MAATALRAIAMESESAGRCRNIAIAVEHRPDIFRFSDIERAMSLLGRRPTTNWIRCLRLSGATDCRRPSPSFLVACPTIDMNVRGNTFCPSPHHSLCRLRGVALILWPIGSPHPEGALAFHPRNAGRTSAVMPEQGSDEFCGLRAEVFLKALKQFWGGPSRR